MKPYRRTNKEFMVELKSASRVGRVRVLAREFGKDVRALWHYGSPFPTFLKLIATLVLCILIVLPLVYPVFIFVVTYYTFTNLFLSWWWKESWRFHPVFIIQEMISAVNRPCHPRDIWKVREVLTRGILLIHSFATSVDYLCVMQGLLDDAT